MGIRRKGGATEIVRGLDLEVAPGEKLGVVGESGSGKTLTMLSVLALLAPPLEMLEGSIRLDGEELRSVPKRRLQEVRGGEVAMIYQDPMTSLNPLLRIGSQIDETLRAHGSARPLAQRRTEEVLSQVGLSDPGRVRAAFPHELSGGMLQRVMIAMALSTSPRLLIADEPTTALDVTIQQQIIRLVDELQRTTGMAVVWVTHDLGVIAALVDRVAVMYAGRVVETSSTKQLFRAPQHPYTAALLGSLPGPGTGHREALHQMPSALPGSGAVSRGCPFAPRCPEVFDRCTSEEPGLLLRETAHRAACWRPRQEWTS